MNFLIEVDECYTTVHMTQRQGQGQGQGHDTFEVINSSIFKVYLGISSTIYTLNWQMATG